MGRRHRQRPRHRRRAARFHYICGSAGNAALIAFTRALGGKSLADNIRVVGINPGPVGTDRHVTLLKTRAKNQFGDENRYKEFQKGMPLGRPAHAREIGDLMAFLASDRVRIYFRRDLYRGRRAYSRVGLRPIPVITSEAKQSISLPGTGIASSETVIGLAFARPIGSSHDGPQDADQVSPRRLRTALLPTLDRLE